MFEREEEGREPNGGFHGLRGEYVLCDFLRAW